MTERILCAAIKFKDQIIPGFRHAECRNLMFEIVALDIIAYDKPVSIDRHNHDQGFLTSTGRFVDRIKGMDIAIKADQVEIKNGLRVEKLYSEDLY